MGTLTAEQQAKVDALTKKSSLLWAAILEAKAPTALGLAARDGVAFDKLNDECVASVATAVVLYEKKLAGLVAELAKAPDPAPQNGTPEPSKPAAPSVIEPDSVTPPKGKNESPAVQKS